MDNKIDDEDIKIIISFIESQIKWDYFVKFQLESIKPNKRKGVLIPKK
jgi:hypothetical protein